jgi:hypothetical protein
MIDAYLEKLSAELRRRGIAGNREIEEIRDHLTDSADAMVAQGVTRPDAERQAIERMGDAAEIARQIAASQFRLGNALALASAVALGLAIAYVDSRPHWDDAGITAFALLGAALVIALCVPRRPWLWALGVGVWIPLHTIVRTGRPGAAIMFVLLLFPLAGAYFGAYMRRAISGRTETIFFF